MATAETTLLSTSNADAVGERIRFTFNGGIFSERVAGRPVRGRPNVLDCHHQVRIGRPPTPWSDLWWTLPDGPGGEAKVGDEAARVLVEEMTPYLLRMITDEALRDYWYARWADATASYEEVTYLERLVAVLGPKNLLPDLSAAVEGGGSAHARRQMSQLRADSRATLTSLLVRDVHSYITFRARRRASGSALRRSPRGRQGAP